MLEIKCQFSDGKNKEKKWFNTDLQLKKPSANSLL